MTVNVSSAGKRQALGLEACHVIIVDDDADCLDEFVEMVGALGYPCHRASVADEALRMISENPKIGIVISDIMMPAMDGLTLLDELSARFVPVRPIVAIIITGAASLEAAVQAMRSNAIDLLAKPVSLSALAAALRRASVRWAQLVGQFRLLALSRVGGDLLPVDGQEARSERVAPPGKEELQAFVRSLVRSRQIRSDFLDATLFADPAWDILLDLTSAGLAGTPVPVTSVCAAAQVPLSTALRYVRQLVEAGLVRRWQDETDKRRSLLELEPQTLDAMTRYLSVIWSRQGGVVI